MGDGRVVTEEEDKKRLWEHPMVTRNVALFGLTSDIVRSTLDYVTKDILDNKPGCSGVGSLTADRAEAQVPKGTRPQLESCATSSGSAEKVGKAANPHRAHQVPKPSSSRSEEKRKKVAENTMKVLDRPQKISKTTSVSEASPRQIIAKPPRKASAPSTSRPIPSAEETRKRPREGGSSSDEPGEWASVSTTMSPDAALSFASPEREDEDLVEPNPPKKRVARLTSRNNSISPRRPTLDDDLFTSEDDGRSANGARGILLIPPLPSGPKERGNRYSGSGYINGTPRHFQRRYPS